MVNAAKQNASYGMRPAFRRFISAALFVSLSLIQSAFGSTLYSDSNVDTLYPPNHTGNGYKSTQAKKRKYVNTKNDYNDHNGSHVERVRKMAVAAARAHPDLFSEVDLKLLDEYAGWHDREKFLNHFSSKLYKAYGKQVKENDGRPIAGFEHHFKMVDQLNAAGEDFEWRFFLKYNTDHRFITPNGEYTPLAKLYQVIVKAVDRADRALSEVSPEEFGKLMESLSEYAKKNPGLISDTELMIAAFFEAPVSEAERIEFLRQYVTPTRSLEDLKKNYKTITRYDVVNQGSRFREFQYRKKFNAATTCILNSISNNPRLHLH
jgi:hypothetical protein